MKTLATARTFEELLVPDVALSPYDFEVIFNGSGFFARRQSKRRFRLLQNLDSDIQPLLMADERVFFATSGYTVSLSEHFFVGWAARYLNRRAIIFTTSRVLLIQVDRKLRPRELISQIRYEQIASVRATWNGICEIRLQDGKKHKFQGVGRSERKFLHKFLSDAVRPIPALKGQKVDAPENLCRACHSVVAGHPDACPYCGAAFKPARTAALLSLIFPGLGGFYLGHRGFAVFEVLGAAFFWFVLIIEPLLAGGWMDQNTGDFYPLTAAGLLFSSIPLLVMHALDALMTRHFARKGHHLKNKGDIRARIVATGE